MNITEITNTKLPKVKPIKEKMDLFIPGIDVPGVANRNGFISLYCGAPGSGKSSLMLSMLKDKAFYKKKFHNIYYFCPPASRQSVVNHPLKHLKTTFDELLPETLDCIYKQLAALKEYNEEEGNDIEYSVIIIDDFGDMLREPEIVAALNRILIKSRHICCAVILCAQSYLHVDPKLRKLLTNIQLFRPNTEKEWKNLYEEHMSNLSKEELIALHTHAFNEPYSHLDIATREPEKDRYYRNFNKLILTHKGNEP